MEKQNILIVDDDKDIVNLISDILEDEGYTIRSAFNGIDALKLIIDNKFDLLIIDLMLPDINGYEICKKIRDDITAPIIILSAKNKVMDKVIGFELGADDYITKPFDDNELIARVKAHLRRSKRNESNNSPEKEGILKFKGIALNKNSYEVHIGNSKTELSTKEFQILAYMMEYSNIVLTRDQIYNAVWGYEDFGDVTTVTVHIKKLREKIDKEGNYIKTIWGVGYKFVGEKI
ncbi:MAG: response regulator transcription factor [Clostridiaceae bacterium]|nr:response regulator transcription factor [Clostridiaceae bacterium]